MAKGLRNIDIVSSVKISKKTPKQQVMILTIQISRLHNKGLRKIDTGRKVKIWKKKNTLATGDELEPLCTICMQLLPTELRFVHAQLRVDSFQPPICGLPASSFKPPAAGL